LFVLDLTFSTNVRTAHAILAPAMLRGTHYDPPDLVETLRRDDFPFSISAASVQPSRTPTSLRALSCPRGFFVLTASSSSWHLRPRGCLVLMASSSSWLPHPHGFSALLFHDTNGQTLHEQSQTAIDGTFQSWNLPNIQKACSKCRQREEEV
jgi:hypothetical protein